MLSLKKFLPAIFWFLLVLILICLPGDDLPPADDWMAAVYFDKWVHLGLFSVLAFLFMRPYATSNLSLKEKEQMLTKIAIAVSIWGLATEFIQNFWIPGRSYDLGDWAADSVAAVLAKAVCRKLYLKKKIG